MKFNSKLEKKDYEKYIKSHSNISFMQSSIWGEFQSKTMARQPYYVGIVDKHNNILCASLLLKKDLPFGYCYFYAPRGVIIDYKNKGLLEIFTEELKKWSKEEKAIFIKIDPEFKLHDLDQDGNIIGNDNSDVVEFLKQLGYKHFGFNKNFENSQPRYTWRLDLSKNIDDIFNGFHPTTKKILKRDNPYQLELTKNEDASIEDFYFTMEETEKREHILYHDISYYKEFYELLHNHKMCDLYEVKVSIDKVKKINLERQNELEDKIKKLSSDKYKNIEKNKNKINELNNQFRKLKKEYDELELVKEENPVLSSILTTKYGDTTWTVHGGNSSFLRELNANYFIYYAIIKDAKENGSKYIDFFGTTGNPVDSNPVYGIHLFKKRLGGEYIEFIGEFDLVINKFMYFIFNTLIPFYRNIKRSIKRRKDR